MKVFAFKTLFTLTVAAVHGTGLFYILKGVWARWGICFPELWVLREGEEIACLGFLSFLPTFSFLLH